MDAVWPVTALYFGALASDLLSLASFEIGLFGWMAFVLSPAAHHLQPNSPVYWLSHAGEHGHRLRERLADQHLAGPTRNQGGDIKCRG